MITLLIKSATEIIMTTFFSHFLTNQRLGIFWEHCQIYMFWYLIVVKLTKSNVKAHPFYMYMYSTWCSCQVV